MENEPFNATLPVEPSNERHMEKMLNLFHTPGNSQLNQQGQQTENIAALDQVNNPQLDEEKVNVSGQNEVEDQKDKPQAEPIQENVDQVMKP